MEQRKLSKKRIFDIIQIGHKTDFASTAFDVIISVLIIVSIVSTFLQTFDSLGEIKPALATIEFITIVIFVVEYILRLWTAEYLYPKQKEVVAVCKFAFSFYGIVDLLTIVSFFAPFLFSNGFVALKMLRVIRIMRLFRLNATYDAFNVITEVLKAKKDQIMSSILLIVMLMFMSSLCMYSLEHEAQPENFANGFSGIWWSVSTLLTVGYGDIYPVTVGGKIMAIVFAFLGVGMVAIPTGIISAGFVEYYSRIQLGDVLSKPDHSDFEEEDKPYEMKSRVRYSEANAKGRLTMTGLINALQDCCTMQAEDLGVGLSYLREQHMGWVVTSYQIKLLRELPAVGDEIIVRTWPYQFRGMLGYRNFTIETIEGQRIVEADSLWILMNLDMMKPVRLPDKMAEQYRIFPRLQGEWDIRRKLDSVQTEPSGKSVVSASYMDTNHHMNNARYMEVVENYFDTEHTPSEIFIMYKKEARLGDAMLSMTETKRNVSRVTLCNERRETYCDVELRFDDAEE